MFSKRRKKKRTAFRKRHKNDDPDANDAPASTKPAILAGGAVTENNDVKPEASKVAGKIKRSKKKSKRKKRKAGGMLSFGDIDEGGDDPKKSKRRKKRFKLKKSKASRMIMKGAPAQLSITSKPAKEKSQPRESSNIYSKESIKAQLRQQQLDQQRMMVESGLGGENVTEGQVVAGADLEDAEANDEDDLLAGEEIERFKRIRASKRKTALGGYIPIGGNLQGPADAVAFDTASRLKTKFRKLGAAANGESKSLYDHMKEQSKVIFADSDNFEQQQIRRASRVATSTTTKGPKLPPTLASQSKESKSSAALPAQKSCADIQATIRTKLEHLRNEQGQEERKITALRVRLDQTTSTLESMQTKLKTAKHQYNFFQEVGDYVKALCGCLTEKREMILKVRDAYETALKDCEQQQQKKWDEALQSVLVLARSATAHMKDEFGRDVGHPSNGRWVARVESLQQFVADPTELSLRAVAQSGRGVPKAATETLRAREEELRAAATFIFDDVLPEYKELPEILKKFSSWHDSFLDIYTKCHCALSLGDLASIFAHVEALFWDPRRLRRRLRDWEWYRQLVGGQPGGANDSKSAKGGNKPGLGLKSAGEGDKSAGPLGRVATLWLQPLLVSVVENTWDPLSVEQTRALVETIQDAVGHLDVACTDMMWEKMLQVMCARVERAVATHKQQAHAHALGGDTSDTAQSLLLNGVATGLALFHSVTTVCKAAEDHDGEWTPKLQKLSTELFRNCILRPTNQLIETGNRPTDYMRLGRFAMKLYPSRWLSQHIAADTALRLFLQRVSSR